jgi:hypothetical protein
LVMDSLTSTGITLSPPATFSPRQKLSIPPISFLLRKSAVLYNRRRSKITSLLCSHFTSTYVMKWHTFFPDTPLASPPSFDARIILYPGAKEVRDYFSWRQADGVFGLSCDSDQPLIAYQRTSTTYTIPFSGPSFRKMVNHQNRLMRPSTYAFTCPLLSTS